MTAKKTWPGEEAFYTLWNPDSEKPPKVQFQTLEHAERIGKEMALKYADAFVVMKAVKRVDVSEVTEYK